MRAVTPPNAPSPPEVMRDGHVLPAIPEVHIQPVRRDPAKLEALELQLPLHAAVFEPIVAEDDHVRVERALEEMAERSEKPQLRGTGGRRTIQSSGRLRVIHDGSFHGEPRPFSDDTEAGLSKHYGIGWPLAEAG
jgi:hypothetical protein